MYWYNRCHENWLLRGDLNTSNFHKVASGRRRKNIILNLEKNRFLIEGGENLLKHATEYYFDLFGHAPDFNIHLDNSIFGIGMGLKHYLKQIMKIFANLSLNRNALFQMAKNKAAGPQHPY